ncbi:PIN domain-like protein [Moniliophthora roreri]|nr:PIN domain-like protein [Moniliophthora roreri]
MARMQLVHAPKQDQAQALVTPARSRRVTVISLTNLIALSVSDLHEAPKNIFLVPSVSRKHTLISGIANVQTQIQLINP